MRSSVAITLAVTTGILLGLAIASAPSLRLMVENQDPFHASANALYVRNASHASGNSTERFSGADNASLDNETSQTADAEEARLSEESLAAAAEAQAASAAAAAQAEAAQGAQQTSGLQPYTIGELADAFNKLNASRDFANYQDKEISQAVQDGSALTQSMLAGSGAHRALLPDAGAHATPPTATPPPIAGLGDAQSYVGLDSQAGAIEAEHAALLKSIGAKTTPTSSVGKVAGKAATGDSVTIKGGASTGSTLGQNKAATPTGVSGDLAGQMSALDGKHAALLSKVKG